MTAGFAGHAFLATSGWAAAAIGVLALLTWVAGRMAGRHSVIDTAWGLFFCTAALVAFLGSSGHGSSPRRWLLLAMTTIWGLRLTVHIARRSIGKGEDPRYEQLVRGRGRLETFALVYGLQAVLAFLVSVPILVGAFEAAPLTLLASVGVAVWALGLAFEAGGDRQLERFRALKSAGVLPVDAIMDRGLWRYTRHPNYFGDACVWVGIFCVTAERSPGVFTVFAPAVMIYLLAFGSGKRVLERSMSRRPGYRDYMARTSGFLPLPPRRDPPRLRV